MSLFNTKYLGMDNLAKEATIVLTSAQVLALNSTPITLVPAPGAGKYISVDEVVATVNFNSVAYTGANAVEVRYTDGSGSKVTGDLAAAWLNSASTAGVKSVAAAVTPLANAAVVAAVPSANPAAGNSTVKVSVLYRIVTTT